MQEDGERGGDDAQASAAAPTSSIRGGRVSAAAGEQRHEDRGTEEGSCVQGKI